MGELSRAGERFREPWALGDVRPRNFGGKRFRHPVAGPLSFHMESFALPDGSERTMVVLTLDGAATEGAVKRLVGAITVLP